MIIELIKDDGTETGGTVSNKLNLLIDKINNMNGNFVDNSRLPAAWAYNSDNENPNIISSENVKEIIKVDEGYYRVNFYTLLQNNKYMVSTQVENTNNIEDNFVIKVTKKEINGFDIKLYKNKISKSFDFSFLVYGGVRRDVVEDDTNLGYVYFSAKKGTYASINSSDGVDVNAYDSYKRSQENIFDPVTGIFTVIESGLYNVVFQMSIDGFGTDDTYQVGFKINDMPYLYTTCNSPEANGIEENMSMTMLEYLTKGDEVKVEIVNLQRVENIYDTYFAGFKI